MRHVGVRAEAVTLGRAQAVIGEGPSALVEVVEQLGWEALVHVTVGGLRLTARVVAGEAPRPGDRVRVTLDDERAAPVRRRRGAARACGAEAGAGVKRKGAAWAIPLALGIATTVGLCGSLANAAPTGW